MNQVLRVVFLGTPLFSVPTLKALLASNEVEIIGVITQPDKPAGRGHKLQPPPVKELVEESGIPVFQPKSLRKDTAVLDWLRAQKPDYLVTIAFGQILSQEVLDIPTCGTVNVHASLLPEYRGPNPIQWALLQNKPETGLTTMLTDIGVDTGDMLLKETLPITPEDTLGGLTVKLSEMAGPLLIKTLVGYKNGAVQRTPQPHDQATHAPKLSHEDALLNWGLPAGELQNKIRAQQPWPGTFTFFQGERMKITQSRTPHAEPDSENNLKNSVPGAILGIMKEGIRVQTGQGFLEILRLQPAGKKEMSARDWANGALRQGKEPTGALGQFSEAPKELPVS